MLTIGESFDYENWKWALLFHLDWFGLRPFIEGTATMPAENAHEEQQVAYHRNKMMAYRILRRSIGKYVMNFIKDEGGYDDCNQAYDVKRLWDTIDQVLPHFIKWD
jgi:hypothetical protein